ncbi:MAG: hypothetical protein WDW36_009505 [Sanguina aurantia]
MHADPEFPHVSHPAPCHDDNTRSSDPPVPEPIPLNRFSNVRGAANTWLRELDLLVYTRAFEGAGYNDWDLLSRLDNQDITAIEDHSGTKILPGHRKKLLLASRQIGTLLNEAGMVASSEQGRKYDRFRERLMFPILDRRGRVIAFGGRVLQAEASASAPGDGPEAAVPARAAAQNHSPKYLNSPETPLFHKGRELFAMWQVKQANSNLLRIVVVEGYMDVIALHQAGLPIAVATLGTATTPEHTEVLFRAAPDVVFCFDGDRAGRAAAWKALESALPRLRDGRQAYFLFLPDGEDPDSLVRKEGKQGFEQRIREAMPLSDYFFNELSHDVEMSSLDGRARLAERARPLISKLPDGAFRDLMGQELERRSGARALLTQEPSAHRAVQRPVAVQRSLVRSAIALLLAQPGVADQVEKPYRFLQLDKPGIGLLAELLDIARARPGINPAMLVEHFAERAEYPALQKLMAAMSVGEPDTQRTEFMEALGRLEAQVVTMRREALHATMSERPLDNAEKAELRELLAARVIRPAAAE